MREFFHSIGDCVLTLNINQRQHRPLVPQGISHCKIIIAKKLQVMKVSYKIYK